MKNNPLNGYQPETETVANAADQHADELLDDEEIVGGRDPVIVGVDHAECDDMCAYPLADDARPTFYPTCRFCGKQELPVAAYASQADADEAATIRCECFGARRYQDELDRKKRREDNIIRLRQRLDDFAEYVAKRRGNALSGDDLDFLLNVGIAVLDGKIDAVNINLGRFKIKISVGSKSALSISFSYSDGGKMEV